MMLGITDKFINSDSPSNIEKEFKLDPKSLVKIFSKF